MILGDHKRIGKILRPPISALGQFIEISWSEIILPEILWIALIQEHYGYAVGVPIVTELARTAREVAGDGKESMFASATSYEDLDSIQCKLIRDRLRSAGKLSKVTLALAPLERYFPESPFDFLFRGGDPLIRSTRNLVNLKDMVLVLVDKRSRPATMAQATFHWLAFDAKKLVVDPSTALAHFPEVEKYPRTELSRRVGRSIQAGMSMFFMPPYNAEGARWPRYFWNRGFVIDPCEIATGGEGWNV